MSDRAPTDRTTTSRTGIAFLGCGYVANMYRLTLAGHSGLELVGVHDLNPDRAETMAQLTGADVYADLDALSADPRTDIVLNLTNPDAHYATTTALLKAGKHVYSEKPLAMRLDHAQELAALARAQGLHLVSAPCTLMNPVAQTLWKAAREGAIGRIRLVHAEMEDGMVPRAPLHRWVNEAGVAWPALDEFQTGCTVEHAGYVLSWLCAMFGPVTRLTAHAEELMPDKFPAHDKIDGLGLIPAPDLSIAALRFETGVIARMTNGIYAAHDHRMTLFGDDGTLEVDDPRSDTSDIRLRRYRTIRRRRFLQPFPRKLKRLGGKERIATYRGSQTRDFCRALADMAAAIREGRAPYTAADFAAHITEVTLACHHGSHPSGAAAGFGTMPYDPITRFDPVVPLDWAA